METTWVIASTNSGKIRELRQVFQNQMNWGLSILSLDDIPGSPTIAETGNTFLENARLKAWGIAQHAKRPTLADDSGLEVAALGGEPGVFSARYAGTNFENRHDNDAANNQKLLAEIKNIPENKRQARYVCVLVLADPATGHEWVFEGECRGEIVTTPRGQEGFGYDPYFFLPERGCTMAEIPIAEKNLFSHRGQAVKKLLDFLPQLLIQASR